MIRAYNTLADKTNHARFNKGVTNTRYDQARCFAHYFNCALCLEFIKIEDDCDFSLLAQMMVRLNPLINCVDGVKKGTFVSFSDARMICQSGAVQPSNLHGMPLLQVHGMHDQRIISYVNLQLILTIPKYTKTRHGTAQDLSEVLLTKILDGCKSVAKFALKELRFMFFALPTQFCHQEQLNLC